MQQTHYDTLKVSRDAPIEVIRAAYRVLSLKHHPDRHPADSTAADTMGLLNKAYEVLSDPERRLAHDAWILQIEAGSSHVRTSKTTASPPARIDPEREIGSDAEPIGRVALYFRRLGIVFGVALLAAASLVVFLSVTHQPQMKGWVAVAPAPEEREAYIRQVARELMLRRGDGAQGSAAVPTAPDGAASPSDNSPASATERETPVRPPELRSNDTAPPPNDTARPAAHPMEEARFAPELPFVSQPNEEVVDHATTPSNDVNSAGTR